MLDKSFGRLSPLKDRGDIKPDVVQSEVAGKESVIVEEDFPMELEDELKERFLNF